MNTRHTIDHVDVGDVRLAFRVDGRERGPSLVFVNSLGTDLHMWDAQATSLGEHFQVLRYDCRGHGQSTVGGDTTSLDQLGSDLVSLLDHLGIQRAHVCGLSLGGLVAQWLTIHRPARVERAIFANTAARLGSRESWDERIAMVRARGMRGVSQMVVDRFLGPECRAECPSLAQRIEAMVEATPPDGYVAACVALRDADLRAEVRRIDTPVLVIVSDLDASTPAWQGEELHHAIAGSERATILGAAHLSNVVRPEEFNSLVSHFLGAE